MDQTFAEAAALLRQHEVGRRAYIETPFGRRLICYADLTASGRYLHFVEAWMRRVRPFYANSHTAVSSTGRLMTDLREAARQVVRRSVHAGIDDVALFTGAGATAAVNKLIGLIGLRIPEPLERAYQLSDGIPASERPVVFIGPYEHHSNELPWIESVADVVEVGFAADGTVDCSDLERQLAAHADRPLKVGSFSAASNVTGILTDVAAVARVLHAAGAYACFDFAAAGPYLPIEMHPSDPAERLDAIFLSMHKFIGGPDASGVLVVHRDLVRTRTPERPGGGTVDYVAGPTVVDYTTDLAQREEGGTPSIIGDIRAGAAFLVKEMAGVSAIREHEIALAKQALARLAGHPRIAVLGPHDSPRLAIISFNIVGLHHDLVAALLDQLFGIQNRAGCSCAGPYGHRLLGIDADRSAQFRAAVLRGVEGLKPGWVRLTLPFYASPADIDFMLEAVEFVADHGEAYVPLYELCWADGVWRHHESPVPGVPAIELTVDSLLEAAQSSAVEDHEASLSEAQIERERRRYMAEAQQLAVALEARWREEPPAWNPPSGDPTVDDLVWFRYAHSDTVPSS